MGSLPWTIWCIPDVVGKFSLNFSFGYDGLGSRDASITDCEILPRGLTPFPLN